MPRGNFDPPPGGGSWPPEYYQIWNRGTNVATGPFAGTGDNNRPDLFPDALPGNIPGPGYVGASPEPSVVTNGVAPSYLPEWLAHILGYGGRNNINLNYMAPAVSPMSQGAFAGPAFAGAPPNPAFIPTMGAAPRGTNVMGSGILDVNSQAKLLRPARA